MARKKAPEHGDWASLPDGDAERLVSVCRRCVEEESPRQSPRVSLMMLAIQRVLETTPVHTKNFDLDAVFRQIQQIADGVEDVSAAIIEEARSVKRRLKPESFFTGFVSGRKADERGKFNFHMRQASMKLGLDYEAAIGTWKHGGVIKYRMKRLPSTGIEGLKTLIQSGASLLATKGWAAEEVGRAYQDARALEEKLLARHMILTPRLRAEVAIGLWSNSLIRGDFSAARVESSRLLELAEQSGDHDIRVVAYRTVGTDALWLGDFVGAESYLRKCLDELASGPEYQPFATDLGASPYSFACSDLADALWALGRYQEALDTVHRARDHAFEKGHYFHYCYSLTFSSWIQFKLGELETAASESATLLEWADRCGLAAFRALGTVLDGLIQAYSADDASEGIGRLYAGLGAWQAGGAGMLVCYFFADAARAWLRCDHSHAAELELGKAFRVAESTAEGYYLAEMYRLQGDIRLQKCEFTEAEVDLRRSLEIGTAQQANTFRLRAAASLLELARERDDLPTRRKKQDIAQRERELRTIYETFEREADSADLRQARDLLEQTDRTRPRR